MLPPTKLVALFGPRICAKRISLLVIHQHKQRSRRSSPGPGVSPNSSHRARAALDPGRSAGGGRPPAPRERGRWQRRLPAPSGERRASGARKALRDAAELGLDCARAVPAPRSWEPRGPAPTSAQRRLAAHTMERVGGGPLGRPLVPSPGPWRAGEAGRAGAIEKTPAHPPPTPTLPNGCEPGMRAGAQGRGSERKCHPLQSGDGDVTATVSL